MSLPKEGSRDIFDGIIISMVPDVCLTPQGNSMVPIPYTIWCRQADAANLANSVRQTDDRSHAKGSLILRCFGGEPGTGGGIVSGTTSAECTPKTWSETVRVENRNMVRHTDLWWMNHRNTYGKLFFVKDLTNYDTPELETIIPKIRSLTKVQSVGASITPQRTQLAQADGGTCTTPSPFWDGIHTAVSELGFPHVGQKPVDIPLGDVRVRRKKDVCLQEWNQERTECFSSYPKGNPHLDCRRGCLDRANTRLEVCYEEGGPASHPPKWNHLYDCLDIPQLH